MLPTFLGIGVPRAGTTWLHELLGSHPDVVMSDERKEVHFFDQSFDRGLDWYERFFRTTDPLPLAVGEYTPHYLYDAEAARRVRSVESVERFVVSFRDPVERAISHYRFRQLVDGYRSSFDDFLVAYPQATVWGFYARHLAAWLDVFERDRFLVLVFESAVIDVEATKTALADHLGIDPDRFPPGSGDTQRNEGYVPRHPRLQRVARRAARRLRAVNADWAIKLARRGRLVDAAKRRAPASGPEPVSGDARQRLRDLYQPDIDRLEGLTGLDFAVWRPAGTSP